MSELLSFVVGTVIGSVLVGVLMAGALETSAKRGHMTVGGQLYLVTPAKPTASP